jgi:hypothetical protein
MCQRSFVKKQIKAVICECPATGKVDMTFPLFLCEVVALISPSPAKGFSVLIAGREQAGQQMAESFMKQ